MIVVEGETGYTFAPGGDAPADVRVTVLTDRARVRQLCERGYQRPRCGCSGDRNVEATQRLCESRHATR